MKVLILTPTSNLFEGDAKNVMLPGLNGQFEVLQGHAPLISALQAGNVIVTDTTGAKHSFKISKGFVEVLNNELSILVNN